jgi:hypothetical protein
VRGFTRSFVDLAFRDELANLASEGLDLLSVFRLKQLG